MGFVGDVVGDVVGGITGADKAADASREAAGTAAAAEQAKLDYLKETEALPRAFYEQALRNMGAGLGYSVDAEGNVTGGGDLLSMAQQSPLRQAIIDANRSAGEQAIARSASATGGLRGGASIGDLAGFNADLENQALMTAYQDLQNQQAALMGQPLQTSNIANAMGNIGQINAQGIQAAGQAQQQGFGQIAGLIGQGIGMFI